MHIVEMRTKVISMGTFLCASAYALASASSIALLPWLLMGSATLCIDMGTTGFNTFFDYLHGTDNHRFTVEREKVLVHEQVEPASAFFVSSFLFALAALLGLYLAYLTSWYLVPVGMICMLVGFFYTAGPYPISRTPFGEAFAGLFLGSVLFLITLFVLGIPITAKEVTASLPLLVLVGMILSVNNGCDRIGDQDSGRRTLAVLLGKQGSLRLIAFEGWFAYMFSAILVLIGIYPWFLLLFLLVPFSLFIRSYRTMKTQGMQETTKSRSMVLINKHYLAYALAFICTFILDYAIQ